MGPAGAPPPGGMPMRAKGGRVGNLTNLGKFAHPPRLKRPGFSDGPQTSKRPPMAMSGHKDFGPGGTHDFGKGGTRAQATVKQDAGSGSGLGRIEKTKREART